jgi:uncharacterized membrane protein YkvA (DUF1232 family)
MFNKKSKIIDEDYMSDSIIQIKEDDVDVVMDKQEEISSKIVNVNALKKYSELGKVMLGMLTDYRKGIYTKLPWFTIATIAFGFLYILNPFDIVPDFIPIIGYIDDLAVFSFGLRFIETDLHNYLDWKLESQE